MRNALIVHRNIHNGLKKLGNATSQRQANLINVLAAFVSGIVQSKSVRLDDVVEEVASASKVQSQIMQLRRWLKNESVDVELCYLPFIEVVINSLAKQTLVLIIDGSVMARGCMTLMVSIAYQGRAIPLLWVTRKAKKGHFPEDMHIELIRSVKAMLPDLAQLVCLGDGEFDGTQWLQTIAGFGWKYVCRTAKTSIFYEEEERFAIQDICPARGGYTEIAGVEFTDTHSIRVNAVAYWGRKYKEPIYLVTNCPTGGEAFMWYRKRFKIETLFSDLKGRGFNLQKSGLHDPERVSRLLIAAALAYIWIVYLGALALQNGWNKIIHRTDRCDLSLFQLGKRLLSYLLKQGKGLPKFCLILPVKQLD